jgi:hypothetical protein
MGSLLAQLPPHPRRQLLDDLNYLNLSEIRAFCERHAIPYRIEVEMTGGGSRVTRDADRKPIVLERIRTYLATGDVPPPTRLSAEIVRPGRPPAALGPDDRLYYRWYNKTYASVLDALSELTAGQFRNGALARVLIMDFWTRGQAPTLREFASAWTSATRSGRDLVSPEYAFLTDLRNGRADAEWKQTRARKAREVLDVLAEIAPAERLSASRSAT